MAIEAFMIIASMYLHVLFVTNIALILEIFGAVICIHIFNETLCNAKVRDDASNIAKATSILSYRVNLIRSSAEVPYYHFFNL